MRKLTPATPEDRTRVKVAIAALIAARNELTAAGCMPGKAALQLMSPGAGHAG